MVVGLASANAPKKPMLTRSHEGRFVTRFCLHHVRHVHNSADGILWSGCCLQVAHEKSSGC